MNAPALAMAGFASVAALAGAGAVLLQAAVRRQRLSHRIRVARGGEPAGRGIDRALAERLLTAAVAGLGRAIAGSGLLPGRTLAELAETLSQAGFRGANGLALFVGAKIILLGLVPAAGWLLSSAMHARPATTMMLLAGGAVAGLLAPDYAVRRIRAGYLARLERALPDALDLMVICAQAGLGLDAAIERVAAEIGPVHPDMTRELTLTASELQMTADTRIALVNLGRRTGLDSLRRLGATLSQSLTYGTPLAAALRALSAEMRQAALTRFEERAARLPVLLTMPMVLFILPCVFIVVGGPAVIQIKRAFGH
jgi:tight adherence protein C